MQAFTMEYKYKISNINTQQMIYNFFLFEHVILYLIFNNSIRQNLPNGARCDNLTELYR